MVMISTPPRRLAAILGFALIMGLAGCQSAAPVAATMPAEPSPAPEMLTIREGDVLKIAFPGAANLDTQQTVRRDGRINLSLVGELVVTGMTPEQLEKKLIALYASQLVTKEVTVTVVSSTFDVFVTGSVLHPGKVESSHPLSALEAVMEAGGFDMTKADTKGVVVIRNEGGKTKNYPVNLKLVLEGRQSEPFYLKPSDIVYVPEKFSWF